MRVSEHANFHECYRLDYTRVAYNVLRDPIINYRFHIYIFIVKFEIKMADIRDVIVSKATVHGLRYANCVPFLAVVK